MSGSRLRKLATYYSLGDLLILPNASSIEPKEADVSSKFTKRIGLRIPIVSSPMDTVTESQMALEMAKLGGMGVIHRNMSEEQEVEEVRRVKSSESKAETIDERGHPAVAAAVGPFDVRRAKALDSAGADAIVIDTAHGHNLNVVRSAKEIRRQISSELIVGNIGTPEAAEDYLDVDPDALRVGLGSGSICITRVVTGVGVPQASAVHGVYSVARRHHIPVISDGGVESGGDIVKALALGADSVMLGKALAGCDESPGKLLESPLPGLVGGYKLFRGMGARSVMSKVDRYMVSSKGAPEGVEGLVRMTGSSALVVNELVQHVKQGMGYVGARNVGELRKRSRFVVVTQSGSEEGRPRLPVLLSHEDWSKLETE